MSHIPPAAQIGKEPCDCGRIKDKLHCPYCGSYDVRSRKGNATRPHPQSHELTEYPLFKCRHCGRMFDQFQHMFECTAPVQITKADRNKQHADDVLAHLHANDLGAIDNRDFKQTVGIPVEEFKYLTRRALQAAKRIQPNEQRQESASIQNNSEGQSGMPDQNQSEEKKTKGSGPEVRITEDGRKIWKIPGLE